MDNLNITLTPATLQQKPVAWRLVQLYLHDFSEFDQEDVGPDGEFEYAYFDTYWVEPERHLFLIKANDQLAGFAMINPYCHFDQSPGTRSIAEFFVMKKYRRTGIGRQAAIQLFDIFPGRWEVCQTIDNIPAQRFWQKVIGEYTVDDYRRLEDTGAGKIGLLFSTVPH